MTETPTPTEQITVACTVQLPFERITNCLIGSIEGGSTYWLNSFQSLPASRDIREDLRARDMIWYAEPEFWTRGGGATLEFDKPTDDSTGKATIGRAELENGLSVMAKIAPRHLRHDPEDPDRFRRLRSQMIETGKDILGIMSHIESEIR